MLYIIVLVYTMCVIFKDFTVQSSYKLKLPPHLIAYAANIKITETIGQGKPNFCTKFNK